MERVNLQEVNTVTPGVMYEFMKGTAKNNQPKSMAIEDGKIYVYHNQNYRGCFFQMRDAVQRFNSL